MEYLTKTLIWVFTVFSIVNSFKLAALLEPIREKLAYSKVTERDAKGHVIGAIARKNQFLFRLITCPMCFSFYIGLLFSLIVWSPTGYDVHWTFRIVCDAFFASITSWLLFVFTAEKQYKM
jgi:hypothetical protein